jgi:hypothetical protein
MENLGMGGLLGEEDLRTISGHSRMLEEREDREREEEQEEEGEGLPPTTHLGLLGATMLFLPI